MNKVKTVGPYLCSSPFPFSFLLRAFHPFPHLHLSPLCWCQKCPCLPTSLTPIATLLSPYKHLIFSTYKTQLSYPLLDSLPSVGQFITIQLHMLDSSESCFSPFTHSKTLSVLLPKVSNIYTPSPFTIHCHYPKKSL
jgi:hypothetical protein